MAVNGAAARLGLHAGQGLADARAVCPDLHVAAREDAADAADLTRLAHWATRWSPWVAADAPDGLMLDISGAAHLFGGERAMLDRIGARMAALGLTCRGAIAETVGAAHGLARFGRDAAPILPTGALADGVAGLPVAALRLDGETRATLTRLGLARVGDVMALPRVTLARRFRGHDRAGAQTRALVWRLDQMLGLDAEPVTPVAPPPDWRARRTLLEPVQHSARLARIADELADDLCAALARAERGARRFRLHAFRVDGAVQTVSLATSRPTRAPAHITRLLAEKLDGLDAGFGFDMVMLTAGQVSPLAPAQASTLARDPAQDTLARLVDRLTARLGAGAVGRPVHRPGHQPEDCQTVTAPYADTGGWHSLPPLAARPVRLLMRPEPVDVIADVPDGPPHRFRWRRVSHTVTHAEGPERISPDWWRAPGDETTPRDYYHVEDTAGRRFWLFRRGLYAARPGLLTAASPHAPRWYLHGLDR